MKCPRILVISNNSFSLSNSNGRTLGNMFYGWQKERLAQLCISTDGANFDICNKYYCISDRDILRAFTRVKKAEGHRLQIGESEKVSTGLKGQKKTALKAIIRHILWGCNRWKSKDLMSWVDEFEPEAVLVQNGDSAFMLSIARTISEERRIPLLMFNTEGYCLFQHDWMRPDWLSWFCFPIYKRILRSETRKTMQRLQFIIHGNQLLKEDFDNAYGVPSEVIYTGSDVEWSTSSFNTENPQIVYLGNFGFNRPESLSKVAKVLRSINPVYNIQVYGKPSTKQQEFVLTHTDGLVYHGAVPYEKVKEIVSHADVLLHAEGKDKYFQEALRYGFSTKIADSISSGKPFLLFSNPEIACAQYIKSTGAGWYAADETELRNELISLFTNEEDRSFRLSKARNIAIQNHNIEGCRIKFQHAITNNINKFYGKEI